MIDEIKRTGKMTVIRFGERECLTSQMWLALPKRVVKPLNVSRTTRFLTTPIGRDQLSINRLGIGVENCFLLITGW